MRRLIWALLAVAIPMSPAFGQQDLCKDILANGVWEYRLDVSDTHNVKAFLNWYGSTNSGSSSSSKKQNFTTGGTYYGMSGDLGLSTDQQKNQEFFSKLDKLNTGYEQYDSTVVKFVKSASAVIVKAWTDCMDNSAGVRASLKFTDNPRDVIVDLRYKPINPAKAFVTIGTPSNVSCKLPGNRATISVTIAGVIVPCTRKSGEAGFISLASDTVIYPDKALRFPIAIILIDLTGKRYATCDIFEEIKNGKDTLDAPETMGNSGGDMGGGTPTPPPIALEVPIGYFLTNVAPHCEPRDAPDACRFVRGGDVPQSAIPNRRAELHPTTDGPRVTVWLSGARQKVIVGMERIKHPIPLALAYGRSLSVEFPNNALDVKLYCNASGAQRIFSLSDIQKEGDQIYLKAVRQSSTGRIMDMAVLRFDLGQ